MHPFNLLPVSGNKITKTEDKGLVTLKHHNTSTDVLKGTIYNEHNVKVLHQSN